MEQSRRKKRLAGTLGFAAASLLLLGTGLGVAALIRARWYAYLLLVLCFAGLVFMRTHAFWRGARILLCWALALCIALGALVAGRPDHGVSFTGTLHREVRRAAYSYARGHNPNYVEAAATLLENQRAWRAPRGYTHTVTGLSSSTLELIEGNTPCGRVIYQLHGGAYILPLSNVYRNMAVELSKTSGGASVALLDYRTAPEHAYPAALEDAREGWASLLALGYAPEDILLVGDSSGANLALALCLLLRDEGQAMPAGIIAISPWADLAGQGASYEYNLYKDPSFGIRQNESPAAAGVPTTYAGGHDLYDPYLSPVYGSFEDFPPMLITVGSWELLESDSVTIHEKALAAGVDCTLIRAHGMFHVYPVTAASTPEGRAAWAAFGAFIGGLWPQPAT